MFGLLKVNTRYLFEVEAIRGAGREVDQEGAGAAVYCYACRRGMKGLSTPQIGNSGPE